MEKVFGLIGYPLGHSFSKKFFTEKFAALGLTDHRYELFEMQSVEELPLLISRQPHLVGLNVTIPHKQHVMAHLHRLDASAEKVGAVNVICVKNGELIGYNSDYFGFLMSLKAWLPSNNLRALVVGNGGAAKAVMAALNELGIAHTVVARQEGKGDTTYRELLSHPEILAQHSLVINTTPLGMHPAVDLLPELPYQALHSGHYLYDLVYNPETTAFMQKGIELGAHVKNGLEMLQLQAQKAWEIWNQ
jgi:shikimate dehydrogenase